MNQLFKKNKKIELDELYSLVPDSDHGIVLVFEEERIREKKDKTEETYLFQDRWYFPTISQTLNKYLKLKLSESKDLEDIKNILERIESKIDNIKENW